MAIFKFIFLLFFITAPLALAFNFPNSNPLDGSGALIIGTCGSESCLGIGINNPSAKLTIKDDFKVNVAGASYYTQDLTSPSDNSVIFTGNFPSNSQAKKSFDDNNCTVAMGTVVGGALSLGQDFGAGNAQPIRRVTVVRSGNGTSLWLLCHKPNMGAFAFKAHLQYSDDNSLWADALFNGSPIMIQMYSNGSSVPQTFNYDNNGSHRYWRFVNDDPQGTLQVNEIEMMAYVTPSYEAFTVKNNRKVGINNPNPEYRLDVVGDANVSGQVILGDEICVSGSCSSSWPASGNPTSGTMVSAFTTSYSASNCTGAPYGGGGSCALGTSAFNSSCFPNVPGNIGTIVTYCLKN